MIKRFTLENRNISVKYLTLIVTLILLTSTAYSQYATTVDTLNCVGGTTTFVVDLSANPDSLWVSPPRKRDGDCCGTDNNCVQFALTLAAGAQGINFFIPGGCGASPSGSLFYQVDCGPLTSVGTPLCLNGSGPFILTFCKPGSNANCYSIQSIPSPSSGGDVITADGCTDTLRVLGLVPSTISWNSIAPGGSGDYNGLLSNLAGTSNGTNNVPFTGTETAVVTPGIGAPSTITYEVCGTISGFCTSSNWCDTVSVTIYPTLFADILPDPVAVCAGGISQTLTAHPIGGTAPYYFQWATTADPSINGATTQDVDITQPGEYSVMIWDITGCPYGFDTVQVTQYDNAISVDAGVDITVCNDPVPTVMLNGSSPVTHAAIWTNYTGTFTTSDTDTLAGYIPSASEITAGFVELHLISTDNFACPGDEDTIIINLLPFSSSLSSLPTGVSCFGSTDGTIDLTVSGGAAPFTYDWNNDGTGDFNDNEDLSNLAPGNYQVVVMDDIGCVDSIQVVVAEPTQLVLDLAVFSDYNGYNISCSGFADGSITLSVSGATPAYSFAWTGPNGYNSSSQDITGLEAGNYSVTITDANGCQITQAFVLTEPIPLVQNITAGTFPSGDNISCAGASDGSIDYTVTSAVSGYTYSWTTVDGSGLSASNEDQSGLTAGTYNITAIDNNGCIVDTVITLVEPTPLNESILAGTFPSGDNISCPGASDGSIDFTVGGGSPTFTFNWSTVDGSGLNPTSEDQSGLTAGSYTVTATDMNGCTINSSITLVEPIPLTETITAAVYPSGDNISCFGANDGSIDLTIGGGSPGYTYVWSTPDGSGLAINAEDQSGLTVGTYNVTTTDVNGCTIVSSITLVEPIDISNSLTPSVYAGGFNVSGCDNDGTIDLNVSGGSPGYIFDWDNDGVGDNDDSEDLSALGAGSYSVVIIDINGCQHTDNIILIASDAVTSTIDAITYPSGDHVSCFGSSDGSITVTAQDGVPAYTYNWITLPVGVSNIDAATLNNVPAGYYEVEVMDQNGCISTSSMTLTEPLPLTQTAISSVFPSGDNISCYSVNDGSIDLSIGGGSFGYTYSWSTVDGSGAIVANEDQTGLTAGTYSLTVTDINGCTIDTVIVLTEPTELTSTVTPSVYAGGYNLSGCENDGTIDLEILGGSPGYTIDWDNDGIGDNDDAEDLSGLGAGTYSVVVTDINGCQTTSVQVLTAPSAVTSTISASTYPSGTNISCYSAQGSNDGSITVTAQDGVPGYNYNWVTLPVGVSNIDSPTLNSVPAGYYEVEVMDQNGCISISSITLLEPIPFTHATTAGAYSSGTNISCFGASDGSIDFSISGGSPGYSFAWSTGDGSGLNPTNEDQSGLTAGTYSLTVTDINGCTIDTVIVLTEPTELTSTVTPSIYAGGYNLSGCENDGTIDLEILGGSPGYTIDWDNDGIGDNDDAEDLSGLGAGTYSVIITDINGCQTTSVQDMVAPPTLTTSISASTNPGGTNISCYGMIISDGSITVIAQNGVPSYSYNWVALPAGVSNIDSPTLNNVPAGDYEVEVMDQNGCISISMITLTEPDPITYTLTSSGFPGGTNISCFGASDGTIDFTMNGGSPAYTYSWTTIDGSGLNPANEDQIGLTAGTYSVTVTDINGCIIDTTLTLYEPTELTNTVTPSVYAGGYNLSSCQNDGAIDLEIYGGSPGYTIDWDNDGFGDNDDTEDISDLAEGVYSVIVTDINGCQTMNTVNLIAPEPMSSSIDAFTYPNGDNISCYGFSDGVVTVTGLGGSPAYSYDWITVPSGVANINSDVLNNVPVGFYEVEVTDQNGCTSISSITLVEPTPLSTSSTSGIYPSGDNISCTNASDGSIDISVNGGSPGYTYSWTSIDGNGLAQNSEDQNGLTAGTYSVQITDINGCRIDTTITLVQPLVLTNSAVVGTYPSGDNISCYGLSDGSIDITVNGGSPEYTYSWSSVDGSGLVPSNEDQNGLTAGTYTVNITDINGCQIQKIIVLNQPGPITSITSVTSDYNGQDIGCVGSMDGSVEVIVQGGSPSYTYEWYYDGELVSTVFDPFGFGAGVYTVIITDVNGCNRADSIELEAPENFDVGIEVGSNYNGQDISCYGGSNGAIALTVNGGTPSYTFIWTDSTQAIVSVDEDPTGLSAGMYSVQIFDANGCQSDTTIRLNQPQPVFGVTSIVSDFNGQNISCFQANDGEVTVLPSGGTAPYSYSWTLSSGNSLGSSQLLGGLNQGIYFVEINDANGCTYLTQVEITHPSPVIADINVLSDYFGLPISCSGQDDGEIEVVPSGGTPGYSFSWATNPTQNTSIISGLGEGTYHVTVTDTNGCVGENEVFIQGNPLPVLNPPGPTEFCLGDPVVINSNSNPEDRCHWTLSNGMQLFDCGPIDLLIDEVGCYDANLVVTGPLGCIDSIFLEDYICINPLPIAGFDVSTMEPTVLHNIVDFWNTSVSATDYYWDFGDGTGSVSVNVQHAFPNDKPGVYEVILFAYDINGCSDSVSRFITVKDELIFYVPNTFTPDGDVHNGIFNPVLGAGYDQEEFEFLVFNRWGEVVFATSDLRAGWDGSYNGKPCQVGTYSWKMVLKASLEAGNERGTYVGHVNLLR